VLLSCRYKEQCKLPSELTIDRHAKLVNKQHHNFFVRGKIIAICEAVLAEEIGMIAGSRIIRYLKFELQQSSLIGDHDEDFITFEAVNSETDHLPAGLERHNLSAAALVTDDQEIATAEAAYKCEVFEACFALIDRFKFRD
jgi:hypothetical protein